MIAKKLGFIDYVKFFIMFMIYFDHTDVMDQFTYQTGGSNEVAKPDPNADAKPGGDTTPNPSTDPNAGAKPGGDTTPNPSTDPNADTNPNTDPNAKSKPNDGTQSTNQAEKSTEQSLNDVDSVGKQKKTSMASMITDFTFTFYKNVKDLLTFIIS